MSLTLDRVEFAYGRNKLHRRPLRSADGLRVKTLFGDTRDAWIAADKTEWIQKIPLYPGVGEKLTQLDKIGMWYVVTTKRERFVKMILDANQVDLAEGRIFGLDLNLDKGSVLKLLLRRHPEAAIHFVEDRLLTLLKSRQDPELTAVQLLFAVWGYNSEENNRLAQAHGRSPLGAECGTTCISISL